MGEYERIKQVFVDLVTIDSPSGEEERIGEHLIQLFRTVDINLDKDVNGNLFGRLEGEGNAILLSAHMDTVSPGRGKKPVVHADGKITSDGTTVLGADDLSAIAEIYEVLYRIKEKGLKHRTIEVLISTGEELYTKGASQFDYEKVLSKEALVLDLSGPIGGAAYAAPSIISFEADIVGKAAHAGFEPEAGIHSIAIAALAIAELKQGHIKEGVTGNIGRISGGTGKNIVPELTRVEGEIRSLNHQDAVNLLAEYKERFVEVAKQHGARVDWKEEVHTLAYETSLDSDIVLQYQKACAKAGVGANIATTFGGSDNNVLAQKGIQGIVIANSMYLIHSTEEYTYVPEMVQVVDILENILSK